jgi:hypothetical protein
MAEIVKLNGSPVRATSLHRRSEPGADGTPVEVLELAIHLRGRMANNAFQQFLRQRQVRVELANGLTFETEVTAGTTSSSGTGEAAIHRYDLTLRELPESAARRAAAARAAEPVLPPPPPDRPELVRATGRDEEQTERRAADDLARVRLTGSAASWATALQQMTGAKPAEPPPPPEPPLTPVELAGAEAVLVGLRLEALIEGLEAAGLVRREAVEAAFARLVRERFVAEATPVVGEATARRAARDLGKE